MSHSAVDAAVAPAGRVRRIAGSPWLAAALGILCFVNSILNGFAYDDTGIIRDNPRIRSLRNFREIWLTDWWRPRDQGVSLPAAAARSPAAAIARDLPEPPQRRDRLYRPLALFTFALNYAVDGLRPTGYHAVNVVLHGLVGLLVWHLAWRLCRDPGIASVAAVLFAVHPIHSEAVANVVGRAEVLASLFLLLGLLVLTPAAARAGWRRGLAAAGLFLLALLSKETAVCYVPVALLALHAATRGQPGRSARWWWTHVAILLVPLVLYLPLRYVALQQHLLRDRLPSIVLNPLVVGTPLQRVVAPLTVLGHYAHLLLVPTRFSSDYGLAIVDPDAGPSAMTALGLAAAVVLLGGLRGYRHAGPVGRWLATAAALSLASYALISNTVLLIGVSLAERLLYWPSVPLLLMVAIGVVTGWRRLTRPGGPLARSAGLLRYAGVAVLVALGLQSVGRNMDWNSTFELLERDVRTYPQGVQLNVNFAREALWRATEMPSGPARRTLLERADAGLARAARIYPRYAVTLQLRGRVHGLLGDPQTAAVFFEKAAQLDPADEASKELLAQLRGQAARQEARIAELEALLTEHPDDAAAHLELGGLLLEIGRHRESLWHAEGAARLAPDALDAQRLLAEALVVNEYTERAIEVMRVIATRAPDDWQTRVNLSALLAEHDPGDCLQYAQEAHRLAPNELRTNTNLAEALAVNGRVAAALERFRLIERGLPPGDPLRAAIADRIRELERGLR